MAHLVCGNRGGQVLVHDGFKYQKNRSRGVRVYWRCWRRNCRAPLQTGPIDAPGNIHVVSQGRHTHPRDEETIREAEVREALKDGVRDDPTRPVRRTYDRVLRTVQPDEHEFVPEFYSARSTMGRVRAALMPAIPATVEDVEIQGEWMTTYRGDGFVVHQDNAWGVLVFATEDNLFSLGRCQVIYMDATFKSCPRPYSQFFTIHGNVQGRVLPLAMILMSGKTIGQYRQVIQAVKRSVTGATGGRFRPRSIVCDFEQALLTAVETDLPNSHVTACYFHFCQSMWRKIQELGLRRQYGRRRPLRRCIRKFMALGYLPLALVRNNFELHARSPETRRLVRRYPQLGMFITYLQMNYMDGNFPPRMWNVFDRDMDSRTNNHVESFHCKWNAKVGVRHPSLWLFLRKMKDEQQSTERAMIAIERGDAPPGRKRKWRLLDERIRRLRHQYQNGVRTLDEYWNAMVYTIKHFV